MVFDIEGKGILMPISVWWFAFTPVANSETSQKIPPVLGDVLHIYVAPWLNTRWVHRCHFWLNTVVAPLTGKVSSASRAIYQAHHAGNVAAQSQPKVLLDGIGILQLGILPNIWGNGGSHPQGAHRLAALSNSDQPVGSTEVSLFTLTCFHFSNYSSQYTIFYHAW